MIKSLTTATLRWFEDECCDVKYLDLWSEVPASYLSGQAVDASWRCDHYEVVIVTGASGEIFWDAVNLLMRYHFYPSTVMSHTSDFKQENRWLQAGDRIVQRIHLLTLFGRPILDVIGLTEVSAVTREPCRYGFTYVTAGSHVEQGQWSAHVAWRPNGDIVLTVDAVSRPAPQEPTRNYRFIRAFQKMANRQGIAHFKALVNTFVSG